MMKAVKLSLITILPLFLVGCGPKDVKDICGNTYKVIQIGEQVWMAENMRCNKYDTESEAYNAYWLTNNIIPTAQSSTYTAYYADASDKSIWNRYCTSDGFGVELTDEYVKKLGYLYNWAAAVGVANSAEQETPFIGNRQGICPNGWHIPSKDEWQTLEDYVGKVYLKAYTNAYKDVGRRLRATSGWWCDASGSDKYGFAALPAGFAEGSNVFVGGHTNFWTATQGDRVSRAYQYSIGSFSTGLSNYSFLNHGSSVRCLRD